jgi:hypothetical protein
LNFKQGIFRKSPGDFQQKRGFSENPRGNFRKSPLLRSKQGIFSRKSPMKIPHFQPSWAFFLKFR